MLRLADVDLDLLLHHRVVGDLLDFFGDDGGGEGGELVVVGVFWGFGFAAGSDAEGEEEED